MKRLLLLVLCLGLLLSGCGWIGGSYASVTPHSQQEDRNDQGIIAVSSYQELRSALIRMLENAEDTRTLSLADFNSEFVETNLQLAIRNVRNSTPMGAYAVEDITYDFGSTGGVSAVVVTVKYNHNRNELKSLRQVSGMSAAKILIQGALERLEPGLVFLVNGYRSTDFDQLIRDYARQNPDIVMEIPQVTDNVYPDVGASRIVELKFTYETSRDSLKTMQTYVRTKFSSATMFVSGEDIPMEKYRRLYSFLMETSDYTMETSITPSYSLLRHGVGDSRALATVYAAMCRKSGMDCRIVTGTREGEPWTWNMISLDGQYYHLDLVECYLDGSFTLRYDQDMAGYVWDYIAYPKAEAPAPEETTPNPGAVG